MGDAANTEPEYQIVEETELTGRVLQRKDGRAPAMPLASAPRVVSADSPKYTTARVGRPEKIGPEECEVFLHHLARSGRFYEACAAIGVTTYAMRLRREEDKEWDKQVQEALEAYKDTVRGLWQKVALEGVLKPIIGKVGKDQDGVIGWQREYYPSLLHAEMKRIDPEYREKAVDINIGAGVATGVLVVERILSEEEWEQRAMEYKVPLDPLEGLPGLEGGLPEGTFGNDDDSL